MTDLEERVQKGTLHTSVTLTPWKAFRIGIINNLLNPLVILLFIGILSSYITTATPTLIQFLYGTMMVVITFLWFSFVALFFSIDAIRGQFLKLGNWLERLTGGVLIAFGIKVAFLAARAL
jgi:threonine/homoserine/homoserine lactone efflux protein